MGVEFWMKEKLWGEGIDGMWLDHVKMEDKRQLLPSHIAWIWSTLILNKTTDTLSVSLHAVTFQIKMICHGQPLVQEYVWSNAPWLGRYLVLNCIDAKFWKQSLELHILIRNNSGTYFHSNYAWKMFWIGEVKGQDVNNRLMNKHTWEVQLLPKENIKLKYSEMARTCVSQRWSLSTLTSRSEGK